MKLKMKKYCFFVLIVVVLLGSMLFNIKFFYKKNRGLNNISYLSEDFMSDYFEKTSEYSSQEEKENMLIVISSHI